MCHLKAPQHSGLSLQQLLPMPYIYHYSFQWQVSKELGVEAHFRDPALFVGKQIQL